MFTVFTTGHIYSNYRAVRSVCIEVFNKKRLAIFLENFHFKSSSIKNNLSIDSINHEENVWFFLQTKHDQIFENVHFISGKLPSSTDEMQSMIKDPINDRFIINYQSNHDNYYIHTKSFATEIIIESLCLLFILRNLDHFNNDNVFEIHQKNMPKIWRKITENDWNISHVLMAETFIDDDDDCDHEKSY